MRDAEADIAEALSSEGWLTVLDGPLHGIRHRRGRPVIGYVKTHHVVTGGRWRGRPRGPTAPNGRWPPVAGAPAALVSWSWNSAR